MQICHNYGFSFGVTPSVDSSVRAILKQSINNKMLSKIKVGGLLLIFIYTNEKSIVIIFCKPRTLNDGRWRLSLTQKTQNVLLLRSSHFVFYR